MRTHLWIAAAGLCLASGCFKLPTDDPGTPASEGQLSVSLSSYKDTADGQVATLVIIQDLGDNLDPRRGVTVTTSLGRLFAPTSPLGGDSVTTTLDDAGMDTLLLRTGLDPGLAIVQASSGSQLTQKIDTFMVAYPDSVRIGLGASALSGSSPSSTLVTLTLQRGVGKSSRGLVPRFTALDSSSGTPIGAFGPVGPSDSTGAAVVTFYAGPGVVPDTVVITGTVTRPAQDTAIWARSTLIIGP